MAETINYTINGQSLDIPRQLTPYLPIDPQEDCLGREEDLKTLAAKLDQSQKVVVVNGLGGIGKTTLAKAWFQSAITAYDHFLWIELSGNDDRPEQRSTSFVETIAWHPTLSTNLHLEFGEKEPPEARFQAIMNALRQLKGRNLFVVDNAGPEMEQPAMRAQLPLPPGWRVLLTSRNRLNGYEPMPLDRLSPEAAAQLFQKHYTGPCPPEALDELLREVDCHTLTVELLAKTLQNHFGSLSLSELTAKMKRRQLADPELQRRIALNHSPEETEVYVHLLTAFDCSGLEAAERRLLAQFTSLPPGGAYTAAQLEEWLKIETKDRRALHEMLNGLDRKGWLTRNPDGGFGLHRMMQQAVWYQLKPGMEELGVLVETFKGKLDFDVSTNYTLLFPWIPFADQILAVLEENESGHEKVSELMNNLGVVYRNLGQYERARDLLEAALASVVKNFGPDHPNVAVRQINLGAVFVHTDEKEKAKEMFEQAYRLFQKLLGEQHPNTQTAKEWLDSVS